MGGRAITTTCKLTSFSSAPDLTPANGGMAEYKALEVKLFGGGALKALEEKLGEADGASPHARPLGWHCRSPQA